MDEALSLALLGAPLMSGGGVAYLFRDDFLTADVAPVADPRPAEPGPGVLHTFADTGNNGSISGGALVVAAVAGDTDPSYYWTDNSDSGFARAAGLGCVFEETGEAWVGLSNSATLTTNALIYGIKGTSVIDAGVEHQTALPTTDTKWVVVTDDIGAKLLYKTGDTYTLGWVWDNGADATLWPAVLGAVYTLPGIYLCRFESPFNTRAGLRTDYIATLANGLTFTKSDACLIRFKVNTVGRAGSVNVYYNYQDAQNYWRLTLVGTTGALRFVKRKDNVQVLNNDLGIVSNGDEITIRREAGRIRVWCGSALVRDYTASGVSDFAASQGLLSGFDAGSTAWDLTALATWPLEVPSPYPFDANLSGLRTFAVWGDSKSVAGTWDYRLRLLLEMSTGAHWQHPNNFAVAGYTVANVAAEIAANLALMTSVPEFVSISLGSNDAQALPAEATFKANYGTIIEAIHAQYPAALIYVSIPVRLSDSPPSAPTADCITLRGWIDDVIASYDYVHEGVDEIDLENGDGYATYYIDTTHMNSAGYLQWANILRDATGL